MKVEPVALLPCPFCGNKPMEDRIEPHTHVIASIGMPDYPGSFSVECVHCEFRIFSHDSRDDAVTKWNKRAIPPGYALVLENNLNDVYELLANITPTCDADSIRIGVAMSEIQRLTAAKENRNET